MTLQNTGRMHTIAELISVIIVFIIVLAVTFFVTKWIANFQKGCLNPNRNIEIIETFKVTTNKYIQIIKTGKKYFAIAICKDTVTLLGELQEEDILFTDENEMPKTIKFKEIWDKVNHFKMDK